MPTNTATPPPPRIAIVQPRMHWSGDDNLASALRALERAARAGAAMCLFPEMTVPGFHRRVAEGARPPLVEGWLRALEAHAALHRVHVAVGAPAFADDGRIFNSHWLIDDAGRRVAVVHKRGLTDPEATFFARGQGRPVVDWGGLRASVVICREVEDFDEVVAELEAERPELLLWPGMMGPEDGQEAIDPPRHVQQAQALARRLGVWVVQSNWPESLNVPENSARTGHSAVIAPDGRLLLRLPRAEAGIGVFDLGQPDCHWLPEALA